MQQYLKLKKRVEQLKRQASEKEGERKAALRRLKELGFSSVKEAKAKMKEIEMAADSAEAEVLKTIEGLERRIDEITARD